MLMGGFVNMLLRGKCLMRTLQLRFCCLQHYIIQHLCASPVASALLAYRLYVHCRRAPQPSRCSEVELHAGVASMYRPAQHGVVAFVKSQGTYHAVYTCRICTLMFSSIKCYAIHTAFTVIKTCMTCACHFTLECQLL